MLLIERLHLTQGEIRERLAKLFPNIRSLMMPFIHPVAEEVESMFLELTSPLPRKGKYMILHIKRYRHESQTRIKIQGYVCQVCNSHRVQYDYHFCPQCGTPIEWSDAQKSHVKEGLPNASFSHHSTGKRSYYERAQTKHA